MVKHASTFSQLIAMIDRKKFHELVYCHKSERFAKKFNSWEHFAYRFKNKLLSLDISTISLLYLSMFPWAKFRQTKGAVKLHLLLDHDGYMPSYAYISNGKMADIHSVANQDYNHRLDQTPGIMRFYLASLAALVSRKVRLHAK